MQKNEGTTLIELLVYLMLFTGITMATIRWGVCLWKTSCYFEKKRVALINLTAALDLLVYDLQNAPHATTAWKIHESDRLIWQTKQGEDIGWIYEKEALWRIQGLYQKNEHTWHKKTKNIVAPAIQKVVFTYHTTQGNTWIDCHIEDTYHSMATCVLLHERSLQW